MSWRKIDGFAREKQCGAKAWQSVALRSLGKAVDSLAKLSYGSALDRSECRSAAKEKHGYAQPRKGVAMYLEETQKQRKEKQRRRKASRRSTTRSKGIAFHRDASQRNKQPQACRNIILRACGKSQIEREWQK